MRAVPPEPTRQIDWIAVAPWVILLRMPALTLGWPLVLGAAGLLLLEPAWARMRPEGMPYEVAFQMLVNLPISIVEPYAFSAGSLDAWGWVSPVLRWVAWLFVGGIISESVARRLNGSPRLGIVALIRRGLGRLPGLLGAVSIFGVAAGVIVAILSFYGWLLGWPLAAPLAWRLWPLVGLTMALPLVILAAVAYLGSPLLVATQVIDRADAFDAVSRVTAFCLQRIAHLVVYVVLAIVIGVGVGTALELLINATLDVMVVVTPTSNGSPDPILEGSVRVFAKAARGFYPAYLFAAGTGIYLLLRQAIDGQPLDSMGFDND